MPSLLNNLNGIDLRVVGSMMEVDIEHSVGDCGRSLLDQGGMASCQREDVQPGKAPHAFNVYVERTLSRVEVRLIVLREMQAHEVSAIRDREFISQLGATG